MPSVTGVGLRLFLFTAHFEYFEVECATPARGLLPQPAFGVRSSLHIQCKFSHGVERRSRDGPRHIRGSFRVDMQLVCDGVFECLRLQSALLREQFPDLYARVDEIQGQDGWVAYSQSSAPRFHGEWEWKQCGWCEDWYVSIKLGSDRAAPKTCSEPCARKFAGLRRRDPSKPKSRYR